MWPFVLANGRPRFLPCCLVAACAAFAPQAQSQTLGDAITGGAPLIDVRLRYEAAEEADKPKDAVATTLRARLGYKTGQYEGFSALVEFDFIQHIGARQFNDSINGLTAYPTVADPDMAALNRLQIDYSGHLFSHAGSATDITIAVGRQVIAFSDVRLIGNAGWRQHERSLDAISATDTSLPDTVLTYAYVARVNQPTGPNSPAGHIDSRCHLFNGLYSGLPHVTVEGYLYLLDLAQTPLLSSATYGLRVDGMFDIGSGFAGHYGGTISRQSNYGNNPRHLDLGDYRGEGGLSFRGLSGLVGYEVLEGDGVTGFETPLGTTHQFQGWAETFSTKPPQGVKDFYAKASYEFSASPFFVRIVPAVIFHDFAAERVTADYGSEWDASLEAQVNSNLTFDALYTDYRAVGPFFDKRVFWAYVTYRY